MLLPRILGAWGWRAGSLSHHLLCQHLGLSQCQVGGRTVELWEVGQASTHPQMSLPRRPAPSSNWIPTASLVSQFLGPGPLGLARLLEVGPQPAPFLPTGPRGGVPCGTL